jgi:hypothetical protein
MKGENGGEDSGEGAEKSAGAGEFQLSVAGWTNEVIGTRKDLEGGEFDEAERTGAIGHELIHRKHLSGQFYTFVEDFERDGQRWLLACLKACDYMRSEMAA